MHVLLPSVSKTWMLGGVKRAPTVYLVALLSGHTRGMLRRNPYTADAVSPVAPIQHHRLDTQHKIALSSLNPDGPICRWCTSECKYLSRFQVPTHQV